MRILMTTDTIGGVWTFTVDLIKALKPFSVEILLASLGDFPSEYQQQEIKKFDYVTYEPSAYKLEWMENPWNDLQEAQTWIEALALDFNPDLVHLNSFSFSPTLFNSPVLLTGHSCVSSWWEAVKSDSLPNSWNLYFSTVKKALQMADIVIAPSGLMLDYLKRFYGPLKKSQVIYNAGDPTLFNPLREKENIIFSMGRIWDEAKNMNLLVESAEQLGAPVYIAGDNQNSVSENYSNIYFLGKQSKDQIACWLSKSAVFVSPSLYEPFGLSALEAAYSGCALLLSDIPSFTEIWGSAAIYFNPHQKQDLINKANLLLSDEYLRRVYSRKALLKSQSYKPEKMASAYYNLYIDLINSYQVNTEQSMKRH